MVAVTLRPEPLVRPGTMTLSFIAPALLPTSAFTRAVACGEMTMTFSQANSGANFALRPGGVSVEPLPSLPSVSSR